MQTHWAVKPSHGEVLSVIGLALDIIGAIVVVLVLFQRFTATFGGRARSDDARDWAIGAVGALFLSSGFLLQLLPHFGIGPSGTSQSRALALALTLCAGSLAAWLLYWCLRRILLRLFP
jgi:protein-S-isoprenylcysteine O-methyltransferase Ste14